MKYTKVGSKKYCTPGILRPGYVDCNSPNKANNSIVILRVNLYSKNNFTLLFLIKGLSFPISSKNAAIEHIKRVTIPILGIPI